MNVAHYVCVTREPREGKDEKFTSIAGEEFVGDADMSGHLCEDISKGALRDLQNRNRLRCAKLSGCQKPFPAARVARLVRMTGWAGHPLEQS